MQQNDKPSRWKAIRRLIEFTLTVKAKRQNTSVKSTPRQSPRLCGIRRPFKCDGCHESSPPQNRQGDRAETIDTAPPAAFDSRGARRALEVAGVEFIDENGGGPGVGMRKRPQRKG